MAVAQPCQHREKPGRFPLGIATQHAGKYAQRRPTRRFKRRFSRLAPRDNTVHKMKYSAPAKQKIFSG